MLVWLAAQITLAQEPGSHLNTQLFRPSLDAEATVWTDDTRARPSGYGSARATFHYANAPFRWVDEDDDVVGVVSDLAELDLAGAFTWDRFRFGAIVPLYLHVASQRQLDGAGLGDAALEVRGTVLERHEAPLGLAVSGRLLLPTSSVDPHVGASATGWELEGIVDRRLGRVLLAANLGTRGVPLATFEDVVWNDQVFARAGAGLFLTEDAGLSVDLAAQTNWASRYNPAGTAAELMGGGFVPLSGPLVLRGAASAGLSRSPGAPRFRVLAGLSYEPDPNPDRDLDGVVDRDDRCPAFAEDPDGYGDEDGCPDPTVVVDIQLVGPDGGPIDTLTVDLDGPDPRSLTGASPRAEIHEGAYTLTATADGYQPYTTGFVADPSRISTVSGAMTPLLGHLRVWAVDDHGAPVDAHLSVSGADPHPADGALVAVPVGEHALVIAADGYQVDAVSLHVDGGETREYTAVLSRLGAPSPRVDVGSDRITISDKIFFELGEATIKAESHAMLDALALALLAHPEVERVVIEGHTDSRGPTAINRELSARRAEAVRRYLVERGVSASRLRSVGYGASRPIARGDDEHAWETNRRVEFRIES